MDENILKGKWKEIKGGIKEKWGKLTDDDLTEVEGKEEKLLGILQKRYGYTKEKARQEYDEFMARRGTTSAGSLGKKLPEE
jgi:uncharacterized protein YjbJ (UPF0337 family)